MKTSSSSPSVIAPLVVVIALASVLRATAVEDRPDAKETAAKVATVVSRDGTTIAYEQSGKGPVVILVACALSDRSDATRLAQLLAPSFTVINFDRRGRGESGDTWPFAVDREIEDIDALIAKAGGRASLFGSSSGAVLALEAANKLTTKVQALVLFEPPFIVDDSRSPIPDGFFRDVGALISADRRGDAVALFMTRGIGVPEEMLKEMRQAPMWKGMEKKAHTLLYDGALLAGLQGGKSLPGRRWTSVTARTLVIDGERSPAFLRNAVQALVEVLPASRRQTLRGQDHSAVFTAPEALAPVLGDFLGAASAPADKGRDTKTAQAQAK